MGKIIPALIFYLITAPSYSMGEEIVASTKLENSKKQSVTIESADTLEKAVYRELNYRIKTEILWTGKIGWGYAKITEKQTGDKREIKVKLTGMAGRLARCFHGDDEIISLTGQDGRKYMEFKKEYLMDEDELDPLIYCMDVKNYAGQKQPAKQKMVADGKRWWVWITKQGKDCHRLNFCEQKNNKPASPLDFCFSKDENAATEGKISFLGGMLQIEGYLDDSKKSNP